MPAHRDDAEGPCPGLADQRVRQARELDRRESDGAVEMIGVSQQPPGFSDRQRIGALALKADGLVLHRRTAPRPAVAQPAPRSHPPHKYVYGYALPNFWPA